MRQTSSRSTSGESAGQSRDLELFVKNFLQKAFQREFDGLWKEQTRRLDEIKDVFDNGLAEQKQMHAELLQLKVCSILENLK